MKRVFVFFGIIQIVFYISVFAQTPVEKSWTILKQGLDEKKEEDRAKAADALGLLVNNDQARLMAEGALSDSSPDVRSEAATSLGKIGLKASIPKLKNALHDKEASVVFSAAGALYEMGDPTGFSVYYAVLTGERKSGDKLMESQLKMLKDPAALAKVGLETGIGIAVPFAGLGIKAFKSLREDHTTPLRAAAAQRLVKDPDPKSAKALADAASDEKWLVRASAISAIAQRGDAKMLTAVTPKLDDPENSVRYNAAAAVIRLSK
jgi:HEAT repeat protein